MKITCPNSIIVGSLYLIDSFVVIGSSALGISFSGAKTRQCKSTER